MTLVDLLAQFAGCFVEFYQGAVYTIPVHIVLLNWIFRMFTHCSTCSHTCIVSWMDKKSTVNNAVMNTWHVQLNTVS